MPKQNMVKSFDDLLGENDVHMLTQALIFSNLPFQERNQVENYYIKIINKMNTNLAS